VTEITIAVNDRRKDQSGNWIEETTFVDVTLWGRQAEICAEYLGKGSSIFIEGRLKLDTWEKDGKKNYKLRVVGERMQMLGGKGGGGGGGPRSGGYSRGDDGPSFDESEYGGEPSPAPAARSSGGSGRQSQASPPPGDDIPF
jgi:single-strand DNA-binding protein